MKKQLLVFTLGCLSFNNHAQEKKDKGEIPTYTVEVKNGLNSSPIPMPKFNPGKSSAIPMPKFNPGISSAIPMPEVNRRSFSLKRQTSEPSDLEFKKDLSNAVIKEKLPVDIADLLGDEVEKAFIPELKRNYSRKGRSYFEGGVKVDLSVGNNILFSPKNDQYQGKNRVVAYGDGKINMNKLYPDTNSGEILKFSDSLPISYNDGKGCKVQFQLVKPASSTKNNKVIEPQLKMSVILTGDAQISGTKYQAQIKDQYGKIIDLDLSQEQIKKEYEKRHKKVDPNAEVLVLTDPKEIEQSMNLAHQDVNDPVYFKVSEKDSVVAVKNCISKAIAEIKKSKKNGDDKYIVDLQIERSLKDNLNPNKLAEQSVSEDIGIRSPSDLDLKNNQGAQGPGISIEKEKDTSPSSPSSNVIKS